MPLNQNSIVTLDQNPTIADRIVIQIACPNADGCFTSDPYMVNNVTAYFVSRDFSGNGNSSYDRTIYDPNIQAQLDVAIATACEFPTTGNLAIVAKLTNQLNHSAVTNTFHYSDAQPILVVGTSNYPAWLSSDPADAPLVHVTLDSNNNVQYGRFEYDWTPLGMREGDYFLCWTWTPNPSGETLSDSRYFSLGGSTLLTTSIPTHFTNPDKYPTLMERYLPEMFKLSISQNDLTPQVLNQLNLSVADGFTYVEDQANTILDVIDANATPESFLILLGNLFHLQLRTNDPTLWRRQIKRAVPLAKMKGTFNGLKEGLAQAGVSLTKFSQLWQVISPYTYQEAFVFEGTSAWTLAYIALAIDPLNFEVYYRGINDATWTTLDHTYVSLTQNVTSTTLNWLGPALTIGDEVRVVYGTNAVALGQQSVEDYIRQLPLADQRDERSQTYPLKNWNVRVIEKDDPLFDLVVPSINPFYDNLVYGKIRTEFAYSENIYNMEEYNGSTRDSYNPCDIDRNFVDTCSGGIGSKFTIDLEIEDLSTNRLLEVQDIIRDFVPFHAILHSINISGSVNDFIQNPIENIKSLITFSGSEFTISGHAQTIFNRSMDKPSQFKRNQLTNITTVVSNDSGTGYNTNIVLYCPDSRFDNISLNKTAAYTYLEVLSPSVNAGTYEIQNAHGHIAQLATSASEPLDQSAFTFRLSDERASQASANIYQDNYFTLSDSSVSFNNVKSDWDVIHGVDYFGGAWTVTISGTIYDINNVLPNGDLVLDDPGHTLPSSSTSVSYLLSDDVSNPILSSTGQLTVLHRGRVELGPTINVCGSSETLTDVHDLMDSYHGNGTNHYVLYNSNQYSFLSFVEGSTTEFYVLNYVDGDVVGVPIVLYQRLLDNAQGYFNYAGLLLETTTNYEVTLGIQNGDNAASLFPAVDSLSIPYTLQLENSNFYQNFLITIGSSYYAIARIDGNQIWLIGPDQNWETTGTAVTFDILKHTKQPASIPPRTYPYTPGGDFEVLDRRGNEVMSYSIEEAPMMMMAAMFNAEDDQVIEIMNQQEGISFSIKTKDGSIQQGEL